MKTKFTRVLATREAGAVRRAHIVPHHGSYTVGQHSFGAVNLLLLLHPEPPTRLIKAVLWHDVAERWIGDIPGSALLEDQDLLDAYERAQERVLVELGLWQKLSVEEACWLLAVDRLELWLWCKENEQENMRIWGMRQVVEQLLHNMVLPTPARDFYDYARKFVSAVTLPDLFSRVPLS